MGWHAFFASAAGWACDGYETYALVLAGAVALRQLLTPGELRNLPLYFGGLLAATLWGWATGGVIGGVLSDYIGRRRSLMFSILFYAVFAGLTAVANSYWMLLLFRVLAGVGLGGEWGPGTAMVQEYWKPGNRGRAAGFLQSAFGVGFFVASGVWLALSPLGPGAWRYMFLVGILPALLILYFRAGVQDPAMWQEADRKRQDVKRQAAEQRDVKVEDRAFLRFTLAYVATAPELRRRLIVLLLMSLASVIGWWSISTWVPQYAAQVAVASKMNPGQFASLTAIIYNIGGITGYIAFGFLADAWGRKPTTALYFLGSVVITIVLFVWTRNPTVLLVMAAIDGFFTSGNFSWMAVYLPELFPTAVRGSAIALVFNLSRYLAGFGPLLAGIVITSLGGLSTAAVIFGLIYVLGLVLTPFAGPEMKGKPLPA